MVVDRTWQSHTEEVDNTTKIIIDHIPTIKQWIVHQSILNSRQEREVSTCHLSPLTCHLVYRMIKMRMLLYL